MVFHVCSRRRVNVDNSIVKTLYVLRYARNKKSNQKYIIALRNKRYVARYPIVCIAIGSF